MSKDDLGLLFLHALPLDGEMWAKQISLLPQHSYAPNLYEFGDDIEVWAQKSLDLVKTRRLIVVGCSVGGSCAIEVARLAEDRVNALVLIGTKAKHNPSPEFYRQSVEFVRDKGVEAAWDKYWGTLIQPSCNEETISLARRIALRQTPENLINGLSAFHTRPSREDFIAQTELPIHMVTGDQDKLPGFQYCQQVAKTAKNGSLHVIASSGHYVPMVQPQALNDLLSDIIGVHT